MAKKIKIVQVAFNVMDPDQLQQYDYVRNRPNKSGYLKRLVQREMDGVSSVVMTKAIDASDNNDFSAEGFI
ncbi:hypothetical protein EJP82_01165 [Paenibacillus anaericanus]|uniref:Uncharacterized protein n=1 Tax=Paenibacillus anaericanus TaxID=170367 RepID=A0A433YFD0_9BACL|nr:hypothetical protein [Paenibacillus anaericanus]RUT48580.1 hypothetical protein EJP82_01165 [Paenibacillus anaericanus]